MVALNVGLRRPKAPLLGRRLGSPGLPPSAASTVLSHQLWAWLRLPFGGHLATPQGQAVHKSQVVTEIYPGGGLSLSGADHDVIANTFPIGGDQRVNFVQSKRSLFSKLLAGPTTGS
ncbi:unnamed protein product [Gadus morhua 'NCC']